MKKIIGLDLGGTFIKIGVVDEKGKLLSKKEISTPQGQGRTQVIKAMAESINNCLRNYPTRLDSPLASRPASQRGERSRGSSARQEKEFLGIGIGTPGLVDKDGKVFLAPNLPNWNNLNLKKIFEEKFSLPVKVENDANAITWGEYKFGAGKGYDNIICITLGTGVGGGIVLDGKLLRGAKYSAVEIGHMSICYAGPKCKCGNIGCIEQYVGAKYIVDMAKKKLKGKKSVILEIVGGEMDKITPKLISEAYNKGDKVAKEIWIEVGIYLGTLLSGLVNLLNPQVIVIGGGVARVGEILFSTIKKTIDERSFSLLSKDVKVVPAKLGKDTGIISASALFLS